MKLTKDLFDKAITNAGINTKKVKIMYNWGAPSILTSTEYGTAVTSHQMLFNNYKDGSANFLGGDKTKPLTDSLLGVSLGSTLNALSHPTTNSTGYGTFAGTDLIYIPEKMCLEDWSVIMNFEQTSSPEDLSKRTVLLTSKEVCYAPSTTTDYCATTTTTSTTTTTAPLDAGFSIGINGGNHLFYEYYAEDGALRTHTFLHALAGKNIIAVSKSQSLQKVDIYIFNAITFKVKKLSIDSKKHRLSSQWYIGGTHPTASASATDQMFVGKIYEFLLFSSALSEEQVIEMSQSLLVNSITSEGLQTVTESYYPTTGHTETQVQTGCEISGTTNQQINVSTGVNTVVVYDETDVYSPVYKTEISLSRSSTASTRQVEQYVAGSKVYDYAYIKNYAPLCFSLTTTDTNSKNYEIYVDEEHSENFGKKATFTNAGYFVLPEDYDSTKSIVIYINGLLKEINADYTRDGILIKKYTGSYTESDTCLYDVIDNGVQNFINFTSSGSSANYSNRQGQDVYLDGVKLILETDYDDGPGQSLTVFSHVSSGRMAFVTRHSDTTWWGLSASHKTGSIILYNCTTTHPLITEQIWINGLRKLKDVDYLLKNPADLSLSDSLIATKSTVIYENYSSYFNI